MLLDKDSKNTGVTYKRLLIHNKLVRALSNDRLKGALILGAAHLPFSVQP